MMTSTHYLTVFLLVTVWAYPAFPVDTPKKQSHSSAEGKKKSPPSLRVLIQEAKQAVKEKNREKAKRLIQSGLVRDPDNGELLDLFERAQELKTEEARRAAVHHCLGAYAVYQSPLFRRQTAQRIPDPFTPLLSYGGYYEFHSLFDTDFFIGLRGTWFRFRSNNKLFSNSTMVTAGIYTGHHFHFPLSRPVSLALLPLFGYTHYYRMHTYDKARYVTMRPIFRAGVKLNVYFFRHIILSGTVDYHLLFENDLLHTVITGGGIGLAF